VESENPEAVEAELEEQELSELISISEPEKMEDVSDDTSYELSRLRKLILFSSNSRSMFIPESENLDDLPTEGSMDDSVGDEQLESVSGEKSSS